jgi:hypothetical protein
MLIGFLYPMTDENIAIVCPSCPYLDCTWNSLRGACFNDKVTEDVELDDECEYFEPLPEHLDHHIEDEEALEKVWG